MARRGRSRAGRLGTNLANGNGLRPDESLAQLAPGTTPLILKKSNLKCSACGDHPPIAPDGKVVSMAISIEGDEVTLHCVKCMNKYQAMQLRMNVPRLVVDEDAG